MKIKIVVTLLLITLSMISSKTFHKSKVSKNNSHLRHKKENVKCKGQACPFKTGSKGNYAAWENLNIPDSRIYSYISNDPYSLQHAAGYTDAVIWPGTLPEKLSSFPYTGEFTTAQTGIHNRNYYDGSFHLSKLAQVNCDMYTTQPRSCVNEKGCGWCGQNNRCIGASPLGPIAPCARNSFIYTLPSPNWNPLKASAINIHAQDANGGSLLGVTYNPDLNQAIDTPYTLE